MKVTILQENLDKALAQVERFVAIKSTLPILSNLHFAAKSSGFFITATNLETGIRVRVGAKIEQEGAITVPAKIFSEFVGTLPSDTVVLELENEQLSVSCKTFKASFQGISAVEYPDFPAISTEDEKKITFSVLKQIVDRVGFSASSDDSRPVLTGMLWDVGKETVKVVSTDGYRLSLLSLPLASIGQIEKTLLLPASVLREVVRVYSETDTNELSFSWSEKEKQVFFYTQDIVVVTRVLDGEFPSYQAVIPSDQTLQVTFSKTGLVQAVKMAAIFARESANIIRWKFSDIDLLVNANSPQIGTNASTVSYTGADLNGKEIAFNSKYLLELLSHIEGENVVFSMTETLRPGVFYEENSNKGFLHVIMPVRVQG